MVTRLFEAADKVTKRVETCQYLYSDLGSVVGVRVHA